MVCCLFLLLPTTLQKAFYSWLLATRCFSSVENADRVTSANSGLKFNPLFRLCILYICLGQELTLETKITIDADGISYEISQSF